MTTLTQEPILVKTGDSNYITTERLYEIVENRLVDGSPYTDSRSAFQGYELLGHLNGVTIGLADVQKVVYLRAHTNTDRFESLAIGKRLAYKKYQIALTRDAFDLWLSQFAPIPAPVPEPLPQPASAAAGLIAELKREHKNLDGWAERGLALYESGQFDPSRYDTRIDAATGNYECNCPSRCPHVWAGNTMQIATFLNGKACKHTIALWLKTVLGHEAETVAYREHFEKVERRGRRPGHTFELVPGDGGVSDQDLEGPLPPETYRRQCQTFINAGDRDSLVATVETMRSHLPALSNGTARAMEAAIDWAVKWGALDAPDDYEWDGDSLVEVHKPATVAQMKAAARASLGGALKSQQPRPKIGSLPGQWK